MKTAILISALQTACSRCACFCMAVLSFCLFMPGSNLLAFQAPSVPIQDVKAEMIEVQDKKIHLTGDVRVSYELGTIGCDKAVVYLESRSREGDGVFADRIDLFGNVFIDFADGSSLKADKGEIFFRTKESLFYGSPTDKVVYTSFCDEDGRKVPVCAKGKKIAARIVKDSSGKSTLSDIRGEGAVTIEYMR